MDSLDTVHPAVVAARDGRVGELRRFIEVDRAVTATLSAVSGVVDYAPDQAFTMSPLTAAAANGHAEATALLIEAGADPTLRVTGQWAAIHWAASQGHTGVVRQLLHAHPQSLALDDFCGLTPLHVAASYGRLPAVRLLLHLGAEVNKASKLGATPMTLACCHGQTDIAKELVHGGADLPHKAAVDAKLPAATWRELCELHRRRQWWQRGRLVVEWRAAADAAAAAAAASGKR